MELSTSAYDRAPDEKIDWVSSTPYIAMHVFAAVGVFIWTPTWTLVAVAVGFYFLRMFGITAGYHRYFSHRGFKAGRGFQAVLAVIGSMSAQKGVLWWAAHHRHHHRRSDMPDDIHSPKRGFWWSHHAWILCRKYEATEWDNIKDFAKYPELVWINRHWYLFPWIPPAIGLLMAGWAGAFYAGVVSTVFLWHGTFTINSLAHVWGSVRYRTSDTSRNNFWLALITMGEGWHNNHHFYQSTARNGFFWWEVDASYYILRGLSYLGLCWDLRQPPAWVLEGKSSKFEDAPEAPEPGAFDFPASLIDTMQSLAALREQASEDTLRARLAERGAEAAQRASEVAQSAAERAQQAKSAASLSAVQAAERAAALAAEAADAASEAAAALKTKVAEAWAEAAAAAAARAHEAAQRARGVAGAALRSC